MKLSKKQKEHAKSIDRDAIYSPHQAIKKIKELAPAKFDETVEVHFRLGIDTRKADQQVRGTVSLPHGTGKSVRVAVFAQGEKAKEAENAGAEVVGGEDLCEKVAKGFLDFDVAIATPDMMGAVGKLGKVLGPRGMMPNPKVGTVTLDIEKAVNDVKAGKVEYRADKYGIVHSIIGKLSFDEKALVSNYEALIDEVLRAKPQAAKGKYLKGVSIASTMGPGLAVDTTRTKNLIEETV